MATLIIAGEAIFLLPFVLVRVFRPTILDVFQINNVQLGTMFSTYGIVAMISYFFGGPIADKFQTKYLMSFALLLTGIGGFYIASIPSFSALIFIYGFWGLTTILLFWAALIKATRAWGTSNNQGLSYGLLEGGRGAFAALIATFGLVIFSSFFPEGRDITSIQKTEALQYIIRFAAIIVCASAILAWYFLPTSSNNDLTTTTSHKTTLNQVITLLKKPRVWLQSIIILCGYVAYKVTDDFSLYAKDVLHFTDTESAGVGTIALWIRPLAAIIIGYFADKFSASKMIVFCFSIICLTSTSLGIGLLPANEYLFSILIIVIMAIGIYALRGLYFAITEESKIPLHQTGTLIGIISVVGYTPDIFMGPLIGYILDANPGAVGHQNLFFVLLGFATVGLFAAIFFRRKVIQLNLSKRPNND